MYNELWIMRVLLELKCLRFHFYHDETRVGKA